MVLRTVNDSNLQVMDKTMYTIQWNFSNQESGHPFSHDNLLDSQK